MNKKLILNIVLILLIINLIGLTNVRASKDDYKFNGYSFGFYDSKYELIYVKVTVDCDYPNNIPHYYEPNPAWNPGHLESYEEIWLTGPNFNSLGNIDSGIFFIGIETPEPGLYQFKVIENGTDVLFIHNFTVIEEYKVTVDDVKWITNAHSFTPTFLSTVTKEEADSIGGIKLSLNLENLGDIPYGIGSTNSKDLNIDFQMSLNKNDNTEPIFSTIVDNLGRPADLFEDQGYRDQNFFKSGETIECTENIINDTLKLDEIGTGSYSIEGFVRFRNLTYDFSLKDALSIESSTPGFEFFFVLFSISLVLFLKKSFRF